MNKKIVMILAAMTAFAAFADPYTWTGGGTDATSWNDENNWEPTGVPGGGDTATFTSAATIADGIVVSSGELKIYANGAAVTISGVISGEGSMYFQCANSASSKIAIAGANTYSGGTTVAAYNIDNGKNAQVHGVWAQNALAFGSNRAVIHNGGLVNFECAGATFVYDFIPTGTTHVRYNAFESCTIDGSITNDVFAKEYFFSTKNSSARTMSVTGKVGGTNASHINVYGYYGNSPVTFGGGILTKEYLRPSTVADGYRYGTFSIDGTLKAGTIQCAYGY